MYPMGLEPNQKITNRNSLQTPKSSYPIMAFQNYPQPGLPNSKVQLHPWKLILTLENHHVP